jgi:hypothetical protein
MLVDIFDVSASTTAATHKAVRVASVDIATGVVTFEASDEFWAASVPLGAALAANDYIVRAGVTSTTADVANTYSLSDEIDGLQRIVASTPTALGGITPTGLNSWWDNQRADASGAAGSGSTKALTLEDIQKGLNMARIAGGMPTSVVTSLGVQREFYGLMSDQIRYVEPDSTLSYGAGFKSLSYNGMPIIADIDAPYGKMFILDESTIKVFSDQDWHFLDADGQTLRQVAGYDKFEAIMARYMNLGATRRNNQVVISNIAVDGAPDAGY